MREAYRQGIAIEAHRDARIEAELKSAVKSVEAERAASRSVERECANGAERANDGPEILDDALRMDAELAECYAHLPWHRSTIAYLAGREPPLRVG